MIGPRWPRAVPACPPWFYGDSCTASALVTTTTPSRMQYVWGCDLAESFQNFPFETEQRRKRSGRE